MVVTIMAIPEWIMKALLELVSTLVPMETMAMVAKAATAELQVRLSARHLLACMDFNARQSVSCHGLQ